MPPCGLSRQLETLAPTRKDWVIGVRDRQQTSVCLAAHAVRATFLPKTWNENKL